MEEKDWILLQTIYEEGNLSKASERLYISQPALTYRIQQLEKEFNTKILLRKKRGVEFTTHGEYLVQYSQNMLFQLRKTKEHLSNMDHKVRGTLRLGSSGNFARYKLPQILEGFLSRYPDIEVNLKTGWSFDINQMVNKEEVHVGITRGRYNWQGPQLLLNEENIYIVSRDPIVPKELPALPRINYQTDQTLKTTIDKWWKDSFTLPPYITMDVDNIDTCKEMVIRGLGYAILPGICLVGNEGLHTLKIESKITGEIIRKTVLVYQESSLELAVVKAFVEFMESVELD
ncbi:LysR family transcriptional regulator [Peribacillus kribbensis]|uniref:LysR family transcriptional regulator n=1 Tax=Peribacillus kribbensis TaxID=356658 RepID=UPI0004082245|nr:LysR family transcriptional regulator [Peribacillus kribbensis]